MKADWVNEVEKLANLGLRFLERASAATAAYGASGLFKEGAPSRAIALVGAGESVIDVLEAAERSPAWAAAWMAWSKKNGKYDPDVPYDVVQQATTHAAIIDRCGGTFTTREDVLDGLIALMGWPGEVPS